MDIFEWVENISGFPDDFLNNYNDSYIGYRFKFDIYYSEQLKLLHRDLLYLSENMKLDNQVKLVCFLNKKQYVANFQNKAKGTKVKLCSYSISKAGFKQ